jgi:putative flavoprotein involved in K+ transport
LSFLGLPWQHTRGSALLGFVQHDAEWLAQHIATHALSAAPLATVSLISRLPAGSTR